MPDAIASYEFFYGRHTFPYFLNTTLCSGSEEHLSDCRQSSKRTDCGYTTAAVVYCVGKPSNEFKKCVKTKYYDLSNIILSQKMGHAMKTGLQD